MIDKRQITVSVQVLLDTWLDHTGALSRLNVDELEHLHNLIEGAIERAYRQGYQAAVNPPDESEEKNERPSESENG